jgi:hypothetical protein
MTPDAVPIPPPSLCRIVLYRSRTGQYTVPAMIVANTDSLEEFGLKLYEESDGTRGVPPLSGPGHVHLVCFTPGIPGEYDTPVQPRPDKALAPNLGGSYQEWDVPYDEGPHPQLPGTWRWPLRV